MLGIDPAVAPAKAAQDAGIPTLNTFFGKELAAQAASRRGEGGRCVPREQCAGACADPNGFVEGIRTMLNDDGVAAIEGPYVVDFVDHCEFDTIYHEHLCYFSVTAVDRLFRRHGMFLNDIKRTRGAWRVAPVVCAEEREGHLKS